MNMGHITFDITFNEFQSLYNTVNTFQNL